MGSSVSKSSKKGTSNQYPKQQMKVLAMGQHIVSVQLQQQQQQQQQQHNSAMQQQPASAPPQAQDKKHHQLSDGEIKKRLDRYIETDKAIREWEGKNLPKAVQAKRAQLADINETLKTLEQQYRAACEKVGHYGSDLENQLEEEVDNLLDRKERIGVAKYKWANGRLLLQHACNQLAFAVGRWQTLAQVPMSIQIKYQLATETRNNLIAASQNIMSAKRYLNNIKFPYCETEEMATLDRACSNIYIDMQSPERHQHALQCYSVTHRRCAALLQWFDSVINNTIEKDLAKAKAELGPKQAQLRKERLRLMQEKIGAGGGQLNINDKDLSDEFDDDMLEPELVAVSEPDKVEGESQGLTPGGDGNAPAPTPLPLNELAPPPSQEDLFGNIEQLRKQHEQEMAQIEKTQETNKARMEQGLQEKLRQRRSRRKRMEVAL
ncbi:hypothetical protein PoB_001970600 [Plakobranchus ocellatus]|uniref:Uncharacterized protein n=1 Tax=Plakobranchus ocellatus TaxID=259542 RepID=A0AAV3Z1K6_9GAST|nr:hypothetical protein PoB_001970600 [Plakobranchus ocellatus]